jgi:hypothetical protein
MTTSAVDRSGTGPGAPAGPQAGSLQDTDPEVHAAVSAELRRQRATLEMIAADVVARTLRPGVTGSELDVLSGRVTALADRHPLSPEL